MYSGVVVTTVVDMYSGVVVATVGVCGKSTKKVYMDKNNKIHMY